MDDATPELGYLSLAAKDYLWGQNEDRSMIFSRKKEAAPCSVNGADTASFKLDQNYYLTQFILQTHTKIITQIQIFSLIHYFTKITHHYMCYNQRLIPLHLQYLLRHKRANCLCIPH